MKGHKVAEGKDGISSPNPELCQRQWFAIYQLASLLEHSPKIWGSVVAVPVKTPLLFASPFICKSLVSREFQGRFLFVIIITNATTKSIRWQSDYLKTNFAINVFFRIILLLFERTLCDAVEPESLILHWFFNWNYSIVNSKEWRLIRNCFIP